MTTYRSPLCLDIIDSAKFENNDWVRCSCGHWFTQETLIEFASSRQNLSAAQKRFADIRESAKQQSIDHAIEVTRFTGTTASLPTTSTVIAPRVADTAPLQESIKPHSEEIPFQPAPTLAQPTKLVRAKSTPTLSTSQWLLTVMAGLIGIALTIFFSVTWKEIPALSKVAVVGALSIGFSFGAIKTKKYFVALSNVLAIIATSTTFIGLEWLSFYGILPTAWSDALKTPFVAIMVALVTTGSVLMGRRFRIWGWLITAPIGVAVSAILFTYTYLGNLLSDGYNHAGYQIAMLSLAILGVVSVTRLTRLSVPEVPELPKAKKDQTDEIKNQILEAEYQVTVHQKEQSSISLASKFSVFAILGYLGVLALSIITQLFPETSHVANQDFLGVDPVGLIIASALWVSGAALLNRFGPLFTVSGEVGVKLANFVWTTSFSITAFAVAYSAKWISTNNNFVVLLVGALLGSALIFSQTFISAIASDVSAKRGSLIGAIVLWATSFSMWAFTDSAKSSTEFLAFTSVIAIALLVRSAVFPSLISTYVSTVLYFVGLGIFISTNGSSDLVTGANNLTGNVFLNFSVALAATCAWTVALTLLSARLGVSGKAISGIQSIAVGLFTLIALSKELPTILPTQDALDVLPLLEVLSGFGLIFMVLALIPSFRGIAELRNTLAYSSFVLFGAGIVSIVSVALGIKDAVPDNLLTLSLGYLGLVVAVLAGYGSIAQRRLALQAGAVFGTVFTGVFQALSFSWLDNFATPVVFMIVVTLFTLTFKRLLERIQGNSEDFQRSYYPVSVALLSGLYLLQESLSELNLVNYSFAAFVVFGALNHLVASGRVLKVQESLRRSFDFVATISLLAITVESIANFNSDTFGRLALLSLVIGSLLAITKRSVIRELDAWIASSLLIQIAIIFKVGSLRDQGLWILGLSAISLIATGLLYLLARYRVRKSTGNSEFSFAPRILPSRVIFVTLVGLVLTVYETAYIEPTKTMAALPVTFGAFVLVATLFTSRLWRKDVDDQSALAILRSVPVIFVAGLLEIAAAGQFEGKLSSSTNWVVTYLLAISVLSFVTSYIRKLSRGVIAAYILAVIATYFVTYTEGYNSSFSFIILTLILGLYVLSTHILKLLGYKFEAFDWNLAFPALIALLLTARNGQMDFSVASQASHILTWTAVVSSILLAGIALFSTESKMLGQEQPTRMPLLFSSAVLAATSYLYAASSIDQSEILRFVVAGASFAILSVFIRRYQAQLVSYLNLGVSVLLGYSLAEVITKYNSAAENYFWEIATIVTALAVASVTATMTRFLPEKFKTLIQHGLPLAALLAPGVLTVYSVVDAQFQNIAQLKIIEAIALLALSLVLLVIGVRLGNLGVTAVSGGFLVITVLPTIWQSIAQIGDDRTRFELLSLYLGFIIYGLIAGARSIFKIEMNSVLYLGVPALIALLPTTFGVIGRLGSTAVTATTGDWTRLAIVLVISVVFLLLGAVRKLAGFFVPGGIALILTVIPLLWTRMTSLGSAFIVVGLLLLAALIGFVAIRLEQVKGSAKATSKWLKELR